MIKLYRMRLFIAINLPQEVKDKIEEAVTKIQSLFNDFPVRFLTPKNWHLTITFLGFQPDEALGPILKSTQETAENFNPPLIEFEEIIYGPPNRTPRMIWLVGNKKTSQALGELKNNLEDNLIKNGVRFKRENREYHTHLTLARFQSILGTSDVLNTDVRRPKIENISFTTQSLDLMESHLKRTGAEYETISQFAFGPSVL